MQKPVSSRGRATRRRRRVGDAQPVLLHRPGGARAVRAHVPLGLGQAQRRVTGPGLPARGSSLGLSGRAAAGSAPAADEAGEAVTVMWGGGAICARRTWR